MEISVLVEKLNGSGYRATAFAPPSCIAEGATREEALTQIELMIRNRLTNAEVVRLKVAEDNDANAWTEIAGSFRDHPASLVKTLMSCLSSQHGYFRTVGVACVTLGAVQLICQMPDWFGLLAVGCGSSSVFHAL